MTVALDDEVPGGDLVLPWDDSRPVLPYLTFLDTIVDPITIDTSHVTVLLDPVLAIIVEGMAARQVDMTGVPFPSVAGLLRATLADMTFTPPLRSELEAAVDLFTSPGVATATSFTESPPWLMPFLRGRAVVIDASTMPVEMQPVAVLTVLHVLDVAVPGTLGRATRGTVTTPGFVPLGTQATWRALSKVVRRLAARNVRVIIDGAGVDALVGGG